MEKITSLFTFNKVGSNGEARVSACINNGVFINAAWLAAQTGLSVDTLSLLVGSSIAIKYFAVDEVLTPATGEGKDAIAAKLCTKDNTIVKSFSVEYSIALTVAKMLKAA